MSDGPKFRQNNVAQCWSCQHRDGGIREVVNGYHYLLPYCSVSNVAMVQVYDNPCREFQAKGMDDTALLRGATVIVPAEREETE